MTELEKRVEWLEMQMRLVHKTLDKIDRKDEPSEHRDCINCEDASDCAKCRGIEDEPQTETEIAKAIVHKMIDDSVIAEDAYPDLRQRMHEAVDEYEPQTEETQTDCAWR